MPPFAEPSFDYTYDPGVEIAALRNWRIRGGRWADLRRRSRHAVTTDVVALGDFNLPKAVPGDPVFEALTSRGLHLPPHSTQIASSIAHRLALRPSGLLPG